ncbi:YqaJ viral recombinase family protein [Streptomyces sp. NPDC001552]|uniref:YqaJ viral recombinase family nuclease n=1 Tax=Streptomyces sp. NPDC001552 TaxID=3364587 RepID=UPI0036966495
MRNRPAVRAARIDHAAAAAEARKVPGRWVLAGLCPSSSSAAGVGRNVAHGRLAHYLPAGSFEARKELTQDGAKLFVRFMGLAPAEDVKPPATARKSTTSAGSVLTARTAAAPAARLLLTHGPTDPAWHAARREGIGGSDLAALLGLIKSRGARHVYEEKHGRPTLDETSEMRMGNRLEAVIAEMFAEETGHAIADAPGTLINLARPWMIGNVDRYVLDSSGAVVAPLEVKNRGAHASRDWEDQPPDAVAVQALWYMAVGGWSHAHVAGLIGGNKLATFRIERDDELIGELIEHCGAWWQRHIVEGFPPAADGLEATAKLLSGLWTAKPEEIARVDLAEAARLRAEFFALEAEEKKLQARMTTVKNAMRLLSGEAEFVEADGRPAWNWKANGTFKSAVFAKEQPELAARFTRQVEALDVKELAAKEPGIHRKYLARVLRVPEKGV